MCIISVNPFLFQYLMGRCLDVVTTNSPGKRIEITLKRTEKTVIVLFVLDNNISDLESITIFQKENKALLEGLGCTMAWGHNQTEIRLVFQPSDGR